MRLRYLDIYGNINTTQIKYLHAQAASRPGHTRKWQSEMNSRIFVV